MGLKITIKADTRAIRKQLEDVARKQVPRVIADALNATAQQAARDVNAAMPQVFTKATPFTRNAVAAPASLKATPDRMMAVVMIKDLQAKYLWLEAMGGTRTPADGSRALVMPGTAARLNGYGNLPKGYVAQLARQSQLVQRARQTVVKGKGGRRTKRGQTHDKGVFELNNAGIGGQGPGGFFRRLPGGHVTRLIAFEDAAKYQPKFPFEKLVTDSVQRTFKQNLDKAIRVRMAKTGK